MAYYKKRRRYSSCVGQVVSDEGTSTSRRFVRALHVVWVHRVRRAAERGRFVRTVHDIRVIMSRVGISERY